MFILGETTASNWPAIWSAIAAMFSFIVAFITLCITIKKNLNERKRKSPNIILTRKEYKINSDNHPSELHVLEWFNRFLKKWYRHNKLKYSLIVTSDQPLYDLHVSITPSKNNNINSLIDEIQKRYNKETSVVDTNNKLKSFNEFLFEYYYNEDTEYFGIKPATNETTLIYSINDREYHYYEKIDDILTIPFPKSIYSYIYAYYLEYKEKINNASLAITTFEKTFTFNLEISYFNKFESKTKLINDIIELKNSKKIESDAIYIKIQNKLFKAKNLKNF